MWIRTACGTCVGFAQHLFPFEDSISYQANRPPPARSRSADRWVQLPAWPSLSPRFEERRLARAPLDRLQQPCHLAPALVCRTRPLWGGAPRLARGAGQLSLALRLPGFANTVSQRHAACVSERSRRDVGTMRLIGAISFLFFVCSSTAQAADVLVATRRLELRTHPLPLSERVGPLLAGEYRELTFAVPGRVIEIAEAGRRVVAGEAVARLDEALERATLRQAELRVREARSAYERALGLHRAHAASERSLESAETALNLRLAGRDVARERLSRMQLLAPVAAVVSHTYVEPGEFAQLGTPVATLVSLDFVRVEIGVPGYEVHRIEVGTGALIGVPAASGSTFEGVVHRVAPAAEDRKHLFDVEIRIPNEGGRLRPGMSARAKIVTDLKTETLLAPLDAVVDRNGERIVFFVADGRAHAVNVSDAMQDEELLLLDGSLAFRELVVRGQHDLRDGARVRVDNTILAGAPAPP